MYYERSHGVRDSVDPTRTWTSVGLVVVASAFLASDRAAATPIASGDAPKYPRQDGIFVEQATVQASGAGGFVSLAYGQLCAPDQSCGPGFQGSFRNNSGSAISIPLPTKVRHGTKSLSFAMDLHDPSAPHQWDLAPGAGVTFTLPLTWLMYPDFSPQRCLRQGAIADAASLLHQDLLDHLTVSLTVSGSDWTLETPPISVPASEYVCK